MRKRITHPNLDLGLGTYRMRNGHTAEITGSTEAKYENPTRVYVIWTGRCVQCGVGLSWLAIGRGMWGVHPGLAYDLVEVIALTQPAGRAA